LGQNVELVTGRRGSFEVTKDGKSVYSRLETGLFPESPDVIAALEEID
jgi:selT/selW/selH-like putative selenoprotein